MDPAGGSIRRGGDGLPTGILHETAAALVNHQVPAPTVAAYEAALPAICRELVALGVVAVHDPGLLGSDPRLDGRTGPTRTWPIRAPAAPGPCLGPGRSAGTRDRTAVCAAASPLGADPDGRAHFGWLKLFADGSMGSRTAAMLEPFEDPRHMGGPSGPG